MRLLLALLLAVALAYWPGLSGDFVFDDHPNIVGNPALRIFDGSLASLLEASGAGLSTSLGRPLSMATFAANLHFWGDAPFSFKLANLLIHLANGLLVYALVRQLWLGLRGSNGQPGAVAFWVTAVWLFHPINLTPVLFVVQRMTSLSAFFTLAALVLYLHGRLTDGRWRWMAMAAGLVICWPAGILAKETALLLPLYILLCEWLVLDSFGRLAPRARRIVLALLASAFIAGVVVLAANWTFVENTYRVRDFTIAQRLMTEARVLWFYVEQILLPWPELFGLHHDDFQVSRSMTVPPSTAWAIAGWIAMLVAGLWQRRRRPWLSLGIFWFLAGHSLESSLLGLELVYEHRNYLPSLGILVGFAALCLPVSAASGGRLPRYAFAYSFAAFCALATALRAHQWGDEYLRTQIESNDHPQSARTHVEAGRAILAREMPTGALSTPAYHMARIHFQRAAQFDPHNKAALASVLYLDCAVRVKPDAVVQQSLLDRMAHARFTFGEEQFIHQLSDLLVHDLLCLNPAQIDELIAAGLANPTASGKIRGMLHAVAMDYSAARLGSMEKARTHALAAIEADPGNAVLHINLIRVLLRLGETDGASRQYAVLKNLRIPPGSRKEVEALGAALGR